MNKEVVLALIDKDIKELEVLSRGFAESDAISPAILGLAKTKAASILSGLSRLDEFRIQKNHKSEPEILPLGFARHDADSAAVYRQSISEVSQETIIPSEPEFLYTEAEEEIPVAEVAGEVQVDLVETNEPAAEADTIDESGILADSFVEEQSAEEPENRQESADSNVDEPAISSEPEPEVKQSLAEVLNANGSSLNEALAQKADSSLANVLSSAKIEDLRQALSLADRFRFQRELFHGNGEKFNTTLITLNAMKTEQAALDYLSAFGWNEDSECVVQFKQLIHRKFA